MREVTANSQRETWTQYDPELVERANLPQEQRLDLSTRANAGERLVFTFRNEPLYGRPDRSTAESE
jgi:hypothetical protein